MAKRSLFKKIMIGFGILFSLAILAFFVILINALPSLKEISSSLAKSKNSHSQNQNLTKENASQAANLQDGPIENLEKSNPSDAVGESENKEAKDEKAKQAIQEIMNEDPRDIRVCENLGQSKSRGDDDKAEIEKLFFENDRTDSVSESFRPPIRAIFQNEDMKSLLQEIFSYEKDTSKLNEQEKEGFLRKAGFYTKLAWTVGQIYKDKSRYEKMADRSGHLMVLAKIALLKPELANDSQIKDFCHQLETSIGDGQDVDLRQERQEVLKMIKYAGLTPEQLQFDPSRYTEFKINSSNKSLNFSLTTDSK